MIHKHMCVLLCYLFSVYCIYVNARTFTRGCIICCHCLFVCPSIDSHVLQFKKRKKKKNNRKLVKIVINSFLKKNLKYLYQTPMIQLVGLLIFTTNSYNTCQFPRLKHFAAHEKHLESSDLPSIWRLQLTCLF